MSLRPIADRLSQLLGLPGKLGMDGSKVWEAFQEGRIAAIRNVGVVCVLLKLKRPFSRNFWMNINDRRIEIPGLIEYTNLNPLPELGGDRDVGGCHCVNRFFR